jgi:hypothetical protein
MLVRCHAPGYCPAPPLAGEPVNHFGQPVILAPTIFDTLKKNVKTMIRHPGDKKAGLRE